MRSDDPFRATINKNFLIKWKRKDSKRWQLVSAGKYEKMLSENTSLDPAATKLDHFNRALDCKKDVYNIITRDNVVVQFRAK